MLVWGFVCAATGVQSMLNATRTMDPDQTYFGAAIIAMFRRAVDAHPTSGRAWLNLALVHQCVTSLYVSTPHARSAWCCLPGLAVTDCGVFPVDAGMTSPTAATATRVAVRRVPGSPSVFNAVRCASLRLPFSCCVL